MDRKELLMEIRRLDEMAVINEPESRAESLTLWRRAQNLLEKRLPADPEDLEIKYLLAYVDYMLWARTSEERLLRRAVDMASDCVNAIPLAKFLLICLYFESGNWCQTLEVEFSPAEKHALKATGQEWRLVKVDEMRFAASAAEGKADTLHLANLLLEAYRAVECPELLFPITAGNAAEKMLAGWNLDALPRGGEEICQRIKECSILSQTVELMRERFPLLAAQWDAD